MHRFGIAATLAVLIAGGSSGQEAAKPGPEHEIFKSMVGTWELTLTAQGETSKGISTSKMDLGGLWLMSSLECEMMGQKFIGRGFDSYDATKKKYISVWMDSMSGSPVICEGTHDPAKNTLTLIGRGPGQDGTETKYKSVTHVVDADTMTFTMCIGEDATEPCFTIAYKRKK